MNIAKWLAALAVLSILAVPAPALQAQSVHIEKECPLMSGGSNCSHAMNCNGIMKCNGMMRFSDAMKCGSKCPNDSHQSQGCNCRISLFSSTEASDPGYSYFGKGSSSSYDKYSPSISSSRSVTGSIYPSHSQASSDGTGPPDLDVIEYLPPSAKVVFDILASEGPLTQKELISKTDLHTNTVRYALGKLKEEGVIKEYFYFPDARQSLYGLNTADVRACRK
jgi:hypothetical protein